VLFLFSCGGGKQPETSQPITAANGGTVTLGNDIMVRVSPGALSADATIAISRAADKAAALPELEAAVPISSAYSIDIRGAELLKPIWVEVVFDPGRIPDDTPLELAFLARFDDASNRWVPLFGMVDPERHAVGVEVDRLSLLQGWIPDLKALVRKMSDALVSLSLPTAEVPKCERQSPNYMSLDFEDLLPACIGETQTGISGEAVLRIANNRAFSVLIHPPENVRLLSPVSYGAIYDWVWSFLAEKVGRGLVYVPPAANAEFVVRFSGPGDLQFSSGPSRLTLAADVFVVILKWLLKSYGIDPDASDFTRQPMHDLGVSVLSMDCLSKAMTANATMRELVSTVVQCFPAMVSLPPKIDTLATLVLKDLRTVAAVDQLAYEEFVGESRGLVTVSYQPPVDGKSCPVDDTSFCDFVYTVDDLLREGNAQGLGSLFGLRDYQCTEADSLGVTSSLWLVKPPSDCVGKPVGTTVKVQWICRELSECDPLSGRDIRIPDLGRVFAVTYPGFAVTNPGTESANNKDSVGSQPNPAVIVRSGSERPTLVYLETEHTSDGWRIGPAIYLAGGPPFDFPRNKFIPWPGAAPCAVLLMRGCAGKVSNVAPERLKVRESPAMDAKIIRQLPENTVVCILGAYEESKVGRYWGYWWPIRDPDGVEGWATAFDPEDLATPWITPTGDVCGPTLLSLAPMYTRETVYYGNFFPWDRELCKYTKDETLERMRTNGASGPAIAFFERTGLFLDENIEEYGRVDVGYATHACRVTRKTRLYFLNGVPAELAAFKLFPTGDWQIYSGYAELAGRSGRQLILDSRSAVFREGQTLPDGRQRMVVAAPIRECWACEPVAYMQMAVIFDTLGNVADKEVLPPAPP